MSAPKARIRVREARPADAQAMAELDFEAFGADVINQLMHPDPANRDKVIAHAAASHFPAEQAEQPPHTKVFLLVAELLPEDAGPEEADGCGEVVAWAKWILRSEPVP